MASLSTGTNTVTTTDSLHSLIAPAYLDRATKAAKAGRWVEVEEDLARFSTLSPHDHRAPLLLAKIRLREGRLAECLTALEDAHRLGHERSENDRMSAWLCDQDRRRHERLMFRKRVREHCPSQLLAIGAHAHLLVANFWAKWNLLFVLLIIATVMLYLYLERPS